MPGNLTTWVCTAGLCLLWAVACASDGLPADPRERVRQTGPDTYQLGGVTIYAASREIAFAGIVNMATGLIEVVACTPRGKRHESVLVADVAPLDVHLALLLLSLEPGSNPGWFLHEDKRYRPRGYDRPAGARVSVFVEWDSPQGRQRSRAERLLIDQRTGETLPKTDWVFVGSYLLEQGQYVADEVGSIITNYHDPTAVIDCPLESSRMDDYTYANTARIPPPGTPVTIRVVACGEKPLVSEDP